MAGVGKKGSLSIPIVASHTGRHLPEELLEPPLTACPLCGAKARTPLVSLQEAPVVELLACTNCRGASVSRMPKPEALDDYYSTYYEDRQGVATDDPDRWGRHIAAYCAAARELSVLDFGGGDGSIGVATAIAALAPGGKADVTVIDYEQKRAPATPDAVTLQWVPALDRLAAGTFDVVLASAVLEHLPDPVPTLVELLGRVAPGGTFYARTPFAAPLMRLAKRAHIPLGFGFPAHLHDMGQPFWDGLLGWLPLRAGQLEFTQIASRPTPTATSLRAHPLRTTVAAMLKAPWRLLGSRYAFVGGWESVYRAGRETN
jgi:SAM-dependent methyltransferase